MKIFLLLSAILFLVLALAACSDDEEAAPEVNEVTYTATDYLFNGPQFIPSGTTKFVLDNQGMELHHQQLISLPDGMTVDGLMAELAAAEEGTFPTGVNAAGGVSALNPGLSGAVTMDMAAGEYVMVCFVPNAEGVPHLALGMVKPITVIESDTPPVAVQASEVSIDMVDFGFAVTGAISAGTQTIDVSNEGEQDHEAFLLQLNPGATVQDVLAAFAPDAPPGPPPGKGLGGFQAIASGGGGSFTADFTAGDYALVCFIGDPNTGAPHFALGMIHEFTVQ